MPAAEFAKNGNTGLSDVDGAAAAKETLDAVSSSPATGTLPFNRRLLLKESSILRSL